MHKPARDTSNSRYHGSCSEDWTCVSFQKWKNHVHGMVHRACGLIYMNLPCSQNFCVTTENKICLRLPI